MAEPADDELSSRTGSPDGEGLVSEDRSLLHQRLAVRELVDTEASYLHVLQLCASDIRGRLQQVPARGYAQPVSVGANVGPSFGDLASVPGTCLMEGQAW